MNLANFLGPMVNRSECEVILYVGETLDHCEYVVSSQDENLGIIGLTSHFGDCKVLEYSIEQSTMHILIKLDFLKHIEAFTYEIASKPAEVIEVINIMW